MDRKVTALYFSATGTTAKVAAGIAARLCEKGGWGKAAVVDFTLPAAREKGASFGQGDVVVVGVPVYAGRVPNVLLKYLNSVAGNGALAIAAVVYGNRNYDDALIELGDILAGNGFAVVAGGAFVGEHSFSRTLGQNRPDERDMAVARDFADRIFAKIAGGDTSGQVAVKGNRPYRGYYVPVDGQGKPADIRKVTPKTNGDCNDCKLCVEVCPMGSIDYEDVTKLKGICIKCGACEKRCPVQAKYYDDAAYLRHKHELEAEFARRSEPELFV